VTRGQKNRVFEAIRQQGADPTEFRWENEALDAGQLLHVQTGATFTWAFDGGFWGYIYSPAPDAPYAESRKASSDFGFTLQYLVPWLAAIEGERGPDLWAELQEGREIGTEPPPIEVENTPFSPEERHRLEGVLRELQQYVVANYEIEDAEARQLEQKIDYLIDVAERGFGRLDWRTLFIGAVFEWGLAALVPPEALRGALSLAGRLLGPFFGVDLPELLP
jgi:hypothetical protein